MNTGHKTLETMSSAVWYNRWLFGLVQKHLGTRVLEIGSGIGNFGGMLIEERDVYMTDIEQKYIKIIKEKFKNKARCGYGDIQAGKFFFKKIKFDSIVCVNVLEHIEDDEKALGNLNKLLKPSGKLILLIPAHDLLYSNFDRDLGHFRRYSKQDIREKLKRNQFDIIENKYINWWAAVGWFVSMRLMRFRNIPDQSMGIFNMLGRVFLYPERFITPPFGLSVLAIARRK